MPYDPLIVCNNILYLANRDNISVTPMKLQKLLYFLYREYLKLTNSPLFPERFEAWKYGPVLSRVYSEFSCFRDKNIDKYYEDCDGKSFKISSDCDPNFNIALNTIWEKYKNYSGIQLSNITHYPETAWRKAWVEGNQYLTDEDIRKEVGESH